MVFVELTPFVRFREEHWTDDELRALQRFLLVTPTAGDVIRGTGWAPEAALGGVGTWQARRSPGDLLPADLG